MFPKEQNPTKLTPKAKSLAWRSLELFAAEIFFMSLVVAFLVFVLPNLSGAV